MARGPQRSVQAPLLASSLPPPSEAVTFEDDSDWEYEYDVDETEDFFFTLDLTTHVPDALTKKEYTKNGKRILTDADAQPRRKSVLATESSTPTAAQDSPGPQATSANVDTPTPSADARPAFLTTQEGVNTANGAETVESAGTLQLLALHTAQPYFIFNNKFYTGYWLSDLGTQLYVSRRGVSDSTVFSGNVLDIIGASQARLVAKPATLEQKHDHWAQSQGADAHNAIDLDNNNEIYEPFPLDNTNLSFNPSQPAQPLIIPRDTILDPSLHAHAAFMERFSALKLKKGETDQVPLHSVRTYDFPPDAAAIRAKALDAEDATKAASGKKSSTLYEARLVRNPWEPKKTPKRPASSDVFRRRKRTADEVNESEAGDQEDVQGTTSSAIDPAASPDHPQDSVSGAPQKRSRRTALGLTDGFVPPPKRKRRSKAEIEASRAAAKAAHEQDELDPTNDHVANKSPNNDGAD